ncbi:hypothetical protein STEG23_022994, partial [Scotinomys teguina]
ESSSLFLVLKEVGRASLRCACREEANTQLAVLMTCCSGGVFAHLSDTQNETLIDFS